MSSFIPINKVSEGMFLCQIYAWWLTHRIVREKYRTPWAHLKEGVTPAAAKQQLTKFIMGRHLTHAPTEYLQQLNLQNCLALWREPEPQAVAYDYQVLRGMFVVLKIFMRLKCVLECLRAVTPEGALHIAEVFRQGGSKVMQNKVWGGDTQGPKITQSPRS